LRYLKSVALLQDKQEYGSKRQLPHNLLQVVHSFTPDSKYPALHTHKSADKSLDFPVKKKGINGSENWLWLIHPRFTLNFKTIKSFISLTIIPGNWTDKAGFIDIASMAIIRTFLALDYLSAVSITVRTIACSCLQHRIEFNISSVV